MKKKPPPKSVEQVTVLLERKSDVLLVKRPPAGLWGGLWEPPTGEVAPGEKPAHAAARVVQSSLGLRLDELEALARFDHVLTHRRMRFHPFRARPRGRMKLAGLYESARWLVRGQIEVGVAAWAARLLENP